MIRKLHIQNYAIIDEIDISFSNNLNVITGETGAGKSILMGALSLILGERADTSVLQQTDKKCIVEGYFSVGNKKTVTDFLQKEEFDIEEELVLRREISATGKTRAFINDTPTTLQQIKQLASLLVDLHQQFDTLEIGDTGFQREVLDALANNTDLLPQYSDSFRFWQTAKKELETLKTEKQDFQKEMDYNQFIFSELEQLNLAENELEDLEAELKLLDNAESIKKTFAELLFMLQDGEQPLVQQLKVSANQLSGISEFQAELPNLAERLLSAQIEIQDIAGEIDRINDNIGFDQERIEWINERLSAGYKLLKKHGVQSTAELLVIQHQIGKKLESVLHIDEAIDKKEKEVKVLLEKSNKLAAEISEKRKKQVTPLEEKVNALLHKVGMPNARLKVQVAQTQLNSFGYDEIEFLFDANKSNRFEPVRKVASGGELSRLMLCIKSLVAQSIDLPTLIFDEIDTGISGEAAKQVGIIMKDLAASRQVICITHQPQIAGKADSHLFVYKQIKGDTIQTGIRLLEKEERIVTIAQMLSGEKPTAAAIENAREMVMN